jgi:hypothetical protein
MRHRARRLSPRDRVFVAVVAVVAAGATTTVALAGEENDPAPRSSFVPIEDVRPNVLTPPVGDEGSTGVFSVDCGTNENGKFSPDNPVAQPGVRNGAQHVHDFVGNLSISADSSDESLEESDTTCVNGDRSSYFWPVVRVNELANVQDESPDPGPAAISCPTVTNRLPAVPRQALDEVNANLAQLARQLTAANEALANSAGGPEANNAIIGELRDARLDTLERIADAIDRAASRPQGMVAFADCEVSYDGAHQGSSGHGHGGGGASVVTPTVNCPTVRDRLPGVPVRAIDEVNAGLAQLDRQIGAANEFLATADDQGDANALLDQLRDERLDTLEQIADEIGNGAPRPAGLENLAECAVENGESDEDSGGESGEDSEDSGEDSEGSEDSGEEEPSELPGAEGPNFEVAGNVGAIERPVSVDIEYRGNPTSEVVPMPKFLKSITGESKPTTRGPANARPSWTCSGFTDRLSDRYVICPEGSQVMRVHDFPSCWDGENTDSENHRDHIAFPDRETGECPEGTVAVPQVRISITYDIPTEIQENGQYQLDSFPEENHNPVSDHNDFANVNSDETMAEIVDCINEGRSCE